MYNIIMHKINLVSRWCINVDLVYRLVKGDGEIVEEIVSRERQKAINKVSSVLCSLTCAHHFSIQYCISTHSKLPSEMGCRL